ncbi:MAG: chromosomal replication initiator protein DnaA [Oscillibacter sp.]|nr:chromosomal replication initiator protein DnaA [Oscillibacter sp.]
MNSVSDLWNKILEQLENKLSETTVNTWFDEVTAVDLRGDAFYLYCPSEFKRNSLANFYLSDVQEALRALFSREIKVVLLDDAAYAEMSGGESAKESERFHVSQYTFDTFVVGETNKLAYAAARAVAEKPGQSYNPLLIYGDSGLGKTHLLYAIANSIREAKPKARIVYAKGDEFINEYIDLVLAHRGSELRAKYREADVLLVDDVQFVAGKRETQNEFFNTFNALYEAGHQIVLTSDRPPSEMTLLDDRLRTRFEGGLLVDVAPPDLETRVAIVKSKAAAQGVDLSDKISFTIAENVTANVRQLEGTVNKIVAYRDLLGSDTDEETVRRAMKDILSNDNIPTPDVILDYVSRYFDVDKETICGQQRGKNVVSARQAAMYLIRTMVNLSFTEIGDVFDGRDHATVMYSVKQVEKRMKREPSYAEVVKDIKTNITSHF